MDPFAQHVAADAGVDARLVRASTALAEARRRLGPITVSAEINGTQLDPQTYSKPGDTVYSRPVPAEALKGQSVKVNFALDKAREPDNVDGRQLGVVAMVIGLQPR